MVNDQGGFPREKRCTCLAVFWDPILPRTERMQSISYGRTQMWCRMSDQSIRRVITWQGSIDLFGCPNRGLTSLRHHSSLLARLPSGIRQQGLYFQHLFTLIHTAPVVRVCVPYRQQRNLCCWVVQVIHSCLYKTVFGHTVFL